MMAGIASRNTAPELVVRKALFARGFRYVLNDRRLAGSPDIVLPKHLAVIWVHGCFWHGHDCGLFKLPRSRTAFWKEKIDRNRRRDVEAVKALKNQGWRTAVVYECAIKRADSNTIDKVADQIARWLVSERRSLAVIARSGRKTSR